MFFSKTPNPHPHPRCTLSQFASTTPITSISCLRDLKSLEVRELFEVCEIEDWVGGDWRGRAGGNGGKGAKGGFGGLVEVLRGGIGGECGDVLDLNKRSNRNKIYAKIFRNKQQALLQIFCLELLGIAFKQMKQQVQQQTKQQITKLLHNLQQYKTHSQFLQSQSQSHPTTHSFTPTSPKLAQILQLLQKPQFELMTPTLTPTHTPNSSPSSPLTHCPTHTLKHILKQFITYMTEAAKAQTQQNVEYFFNKFPSVMDIFVMFFRGLLVLGDVCVGYDDLLDMEGVYDFLGSYFGMEASIDVGNQCVYFPQTGTYILQQDQSHIYMIQQQHPPTGPQPLNIIPTNSAQSLDSYTYEQPSQSHSHSQSQPQSQSQSQQQSHPQSHSQPPSHYSYSNSKLEHQSNSESKLQSISRSDLQEYGIESYSRYRENRGRDRGGDRDGEDKGGEDKGGEYKECGRRCMGLDDGCVEHAHRRKFSQPQHLHSQQFSQIDYQQFSKILNHKVTHKAPTPSPTPSPAPSPAPSTTHLPTKKPTRIPSFLKKQKPHPTNNSNTNVSTNHHYNHSNKKESMADNCQHSETVNMAENQGYQGYQDDYQDYGMGGDYAGVGGTQGEINYVISHIELSEADLDSQQGVELGGNGVSRQKQREQKMIVSEVIGNLPENFATVIQNSLNTNDYNHLHNHDSFKDTLIDWKLQSVRYPTNPPTNNHPTHQQPTHQVSPPNSPHSPSLNPTTPSHSHSHTPSHSTSTFSYIYSNNNTQTQTHTNPLTYGDSCGRRNSLRNFQLNVDSFKLFEFYGEEEGQSESQGSCGRGQGDGRNTYSIKNLSVQPTAIGTMPPKHKHAHTYNTLQPLNTPLATYLTKQPPTVSYLTTTHSQPTPAYSSTLCPSTIPSNPSTFTNTRNPLKINTQITQITEQSESTLKDSSRYCQSGDRVGSGCEMGSFEGIGGGGYKRDWCAANQLSILVRKQPQHQVCQSPYTPHTPHSPSIPHQSTTNTNTITSTDNILQSQYISTAQFMELRDWNWRGSEAKSNGGWNNSINDNKADNIYNKANNKSNLQHNILLQIKQPQAPIPATSPALLDLNKNTNTKHSNNIQTNTAYGIGKKDKSEFNQVKNFNGNANKFKQYYENTQETFYLSDGDTYGYGLGSRQEFYSNAAYSGSNFKISKLQHSQYIPQPTPSSTQTQTPNPPLNPNPPSQRQHLSPQKLSQSMSTTIAHNNSATLSGSNAAVGGQGFSGNFSVGDFCRELGTDWREYGDGGYTDGVGNEKMTNTVLITPKFARQTLFQSTHNDKTPTKYQKNKLPTPTPAPSTQKPSTPRFPFHQPTPTLALTLTPSLPKPWINKNITKQYTNSFVQDCMTEPYKSSVRRKRHVAREERRRVCALGGNVALW